MERAAGLGPATDGLEDRGSAASLRARAPQRRDPLQLRSAALVPPCPDDAHPAPNLAPCRAVGGSVLRTPPVSASVSGARRVPLERAAPAQAAPCWLAEHPDRTAPLYGDLSRSSHRTRANQS